MSSFFNKASVCALYFVPEMIQITDFWSLNRSFKGPALEHDQI